MKWLIFLLFTAGSLKAGEYDAQIQRQQNIWRENPSDVDAAYQLANYLAWDGRYEEALSVYKTIIEKEPKYIEAEVGAARVLSWLGRQEEAKQQYEAILSKDPDNYEAHQGLGSLALWVNDFARSVEHFKNALTRNPKDITAHKGIGRAYMGLGNRRRAEMHFTQAQILELRQTKAGWLLAGAALMAAGAALGVFILRRRRLARLQFILQLETRILQSALEIYQQRNGRFPLVLEQLVREKYRPIGQPGEERPYLAWHRPLVKGFLTDPFGQHYQYNSAQGTIGALEFN